MQDGTVGQGRCSGEGQERGMVGSERATIYGKRSVMGLLASAMTIKGPMEHLKASVMRHLASTMGLV